MGSEAIVTVSAGVVALVQLVKWAGVDGRWGPIVVLVLSAFGVGLWAWSSAAISREAAWSLCAGWIAVSTSAAGVYGFTRAVGERLTQGGTR